MAPSVAPARMGSFRFFSARAILVQCPGAAPLCAAAPRSANCLPIFMSYHGPWPRLGRPVKHDVEAMARR
jgi:hypothetical protein